MLSHVPSRLSRAALLAITVYAATTASAQNDLQDIPEPNPQAEMAAMTLDPLAAVNRFASDPDLRKPIQINFDANGGLWIASSEVYPQIEPGQKANDQIVVLRDTDGDGVSDSRTVFADGLLIPTGVVPDGTDAAYVAESTRLLHLKDTDGDGRADQRRVILSGFGTEDTHHLIHTLRWGPDGCLYFNQSIYIHSHIDTPHGTQHLDGGGIWRYRPSTGELEVICKGFVNPWGHAFDATGESFVTDGAYFEGINYVFPDSVFVTSPGATRWLHGMNPGSPKHCGLEVLSGRHIPPEWSGDLVTSDFRSHRVCRFTLQPNDSGYVSRQQPEIVTSEHIAFRPIDAQMGPDGALYIADWYNPIIQHGEVDFRDERRDREHGRIWRVSFPGRALDRWPDFAGASIAQLLERLEDESLAVRQFAREELWRRDATGVREAMLAWQPSAPTADGNAQRLLERLWFHEQSGELSEELAVAALHEPADASTSPSGTLRPSIRSVWRQIRNRPSDDAQRVRLQAIILAKTTSPDPAARLEAVVCCGQLGTLEGAKHAIEAASMPMDDNLDFAVWQTLSQLEHAWVEATQRGELDWTGKETTLALAVASVDSPRAAETIVSRLRSEEVTAEYFRPMFDAAAGAANASQLGKLLGLVMRVENLSLRGELLDQLVSRTARDGVVPEAADEQLASRISGLDELFAEESWATSVARAAAAWKVTSLEDVLIESIEQAPQAVRASLVRAVGAIDSPRARETIEHLSRDGSPELKAAAIRSLIQQRPEASIEPLVALLQSEAPSETTFELVASVIGQKELPKTLANRLTSESITADNARSLLRRVRSAGGHAALEEAIRTAGALADASWKLTPELSESILALAREASPESGEAVYRRAALQCIECHAIGPAGGVVGPNLISLGGSSQPDYILESLIDPSAKLKEGYTTLSLLTDDGRLISGIVIGRNDESVRLRLADATEVQVASDSIEQEMPGKSLMPAGLLDELTEAELADLVAFLSALGRDPKWTVGTEPIVRSLETLVYTPEANHLLNRTSTDSAAGDDASLTWRPVTTYVNGGIPLDELDRYQQHREIPPTSFVRFDVQLPQPGKLGIAIPATGVAAYLDGKPTPVADLANAEYPRGTHRIVLAIDRSVHNQPFTIRLTADAI